MRLPLPAVFLLAVGAVVAQAPETPLRPPAGQPEPPAAIATIQKERLLADAGFLASDELGGRLTGTPGQEEAARYIAARFEALGLEPLGDPIDGQDGARSFRQRYGIKRMHVLEQSELQLGGLSLRDGWAVLGARAMDFASTGTLRFCGLGRTRGSREDLPEGEVLDGKVAVAVIKPPSGDVKQPLTVEQKFGLSFGTFGRLGRTAKALAGRGAAAVLFVQTEDPTGLSDVLNYLALSPGKDAIEANFPGADAGMGGLAQLGGAGSGDGPPALVLSVPASRRLLAELGVDAAALERYVAGEDGAACPAAKADVAAQLRVAIAHDEDATACNVVAVLRGRDPVLANEAVVFSAHMDHVGRRLDGDVFNGADDNASGSAGLLAIAGAFAAADAKPRRSVIFLSVSGEELGLWGSQYFSDHPTWPLDRIVADVNTDMIGRSGPESGPLEVSVTPSFRHAKYSTLVRDAAQFAGALGLTFTSGDKYYMRSDHYNFARKGIPVVFFCNGEHEDYHQVTDTADKLDGDKMQRIARLAFWTGWSAANADGAPQPLGRQQEW